MWTAGTAPVGLSPEVAAHAEKLHRAGCPDGRPCASSCECGCAVLISCTQCRLAVAIVWQSWCSHAQVWWFDGPPLDMPCDCDEMAS
jgi:hypothetical protein